MNEVNETDKALLKSLFNDVFVQRRADELGKFLADDFKDHGVGLAWSSDGLRGWLEAFSSLRVEHKQLGADGDRAWSQWEATATVRTPGPLGFLRKRTLTFVGVDHVRLENGKIVERWGYTDLPEIASPDSRESLRDGINAPSEAISSASEAIRGAAAVTVPGPQSSGWRVDLDAPKWAIQPAATDRGWILGAVIAGIGLVLAIPVLRRIDISDGPTGIEQALVLVNWGIVALAFLLSFAALIAWRTTSRVRFSAGSGGANSPPSETVSPPSTKTTTETTEGGKTMKTVTEAMTSVPASSAAGTSVSPAAPSSTAAPSATAAAATRPSIVAREPVLLQAAVLVIGAVALAFAVDLTDEELAGITAAVAAVLGLLTRNATTPEAEPKAPDGTPLTPAK